MSHDERRAYARIEASSVRCTVTGTAGPFETVAINLSREGAAFEAAVNACRVGEPLALHIERDEGAVSITVRGAVVRAMTIPERPSQALYGVHWSNAPSETLEELSILLQLMTNAPGAGDRSRARVSTRIAVRCRTDEAFHARLHDLSKGGIALRTESRLLPIGSLVAVDLLDARGDTAVRTTGTVLWARPEEGATVRHGIRFEPLPPEEQERLDALLGNLLGQPD